MVETEFINLERYVDTNYRIYENTGSEASLEHINRTVGSIGDASKEIDYSGILKNIDYSKLMKDIENTDFENIGELYHSAGRLIHNGRIVVYRLIEEPKKDPRVIVPGYETSQRYKNKYGRSAVKVEPIADETEKKEIKESLKELGQVSFW